MLLNILKRALRALGLASLISGEKLSRFIWQSLDLRPWTAASLQVLTLVSFRVTEGDFNGIIGKRSVRDGDGEPGYLYNSIIEDQSNFYQVSSSLRSKPLCLDDDKCCFVFTAT